VKSGDWKARRDAFVADWTGPTLVASSADYYFNSYNHYGVHEDVLKDPVTMTSYQRAVKQNAHLFRGAVVLDVCAGLGICSLLAAQAGAKKVIALESQVELATMGERLSRHNGFGQDVVEFVRGDVFSLECLPDGLECVDIVISEWMGYFMMYEARLADVLHARDRWLRTPGGLLFPDRARLRGAILEDAAYRDNHFSYFKQVWGFNFSAMQEPAHRDPVVHHFDAQQLLSTSACALDLDLHRCTAEDCFQMGAAFDVQCKRDGKAHALIFWFEVLFEACHKPVSFSTDPESVPTCWKQTAFFLAGPQLSVKRNERVRCMVAVRKGSKDRRHLDIKLSCRLDANRHKVQFFRWS